MPRPHWLLSVATLAILAFCLAAPPDANATSNQVPAAPVAAADVPIPILWLEPAGAGAKEEVPLYKPIAAEDPRLKEAERLVDNEAARFTRSLVAWAWRTFPPPSHWMPARLPILLAQGGNTAEKGFRLQIGNQVEEHPDVPFLVLELDAGSLSNTLIHEGAHLLHTIATRGQRPTPWWTAIVHSTFAVTDPLTALAEGYAIHFETLWAHYGKQAEMRAYYHRLAPGFEVKGRRAEFYAPIADLMTFSQTWARYQAVRETWPAFAGPTYPGNYLRSQYDPARDRSVLKSPNAMVSSEGVVASTLFWTVASLAQQGGAVPAQGMDQRSLLDAEQVVLQALAAMPKPSGFRPDIIDLVSVIGTPDSPARTLAISRFVNVTRAVTVRADVRAKWAALYHDAIGLDFDATKPLFSDLDAARDATLKAAWKDPSTLRALVGPVLPVRAANVKLELKMLGEAFELDFDLNAAGEAEWLAAGADRPTTDPLLHERDKAPFASVRDFETRTGRTLKSLGLVPVER